MKTNLLFDILPPTPYLVKFWFSGYGLKCCQPIKLLHSLKCNISRKKWMVKFNSGMEINIKVYCKLISFWVYITMHTESTQSKKFAYLCSISRKIWGMKLIFCMQRKTKVSYKLIVSLWVCVAQGSWHSGKTGETREKFGKFRKSGKTWKSQGCFFENP